MKFKVLCLVALSVFFIGCSQHLSFEELTDEKGDFEVKAYSSSKLEYQISIPKRYMLSEKEYNSDFEFELFVDTTLEFETGTNIFSVYKYASSDSTLEKAWKNLISKRIAIEDFKIYSEGLTNEFKFPAYFEHSSCTISKQNVESISLLFKGDSSSYFVLSLQVNTNSSYPENLKELLFCAKSFKF